MPESEVSKSTTSADDDAGYRRAYFDLETEIRDVMLMSGITASLAHDALGNGEGGDESRAQLFFAVLTTWPSPSTSSIMTNGRARRRDFSGGPFRLA
jgi:hypothetical protein